MVTKTSKQHQFWLNIIVNIIIMVTKLLRLLHRPYMVIAYTMTSTLTQYIPTFPVMLAMLTMEPFVTSFSTMYLAAACVTRKVPCEWERKQPHSWERTQTCVLLCGPIPRPESQTCVLLCGPIPRPESQTCVLLCGPIPRPESQTCVLLCGPIPRPELVYRSLYKLRIHVPLSSH